MIVIEGLDATGKSTLTERIAKHLNANVIHSEGPPKYPGEINERILRYSIFYNTNTVFDRHPCVSQPIYNLSRPDSPEPVHPELIKTFYACKPLIIYCDRVADGKHVIKAHDTPEHLSGIKQYEADLRMAYCWWALDHANIIYRIGDNVEFILRAVSNK